jgi:hypothetical protein
MTTLNEEFPKHVFNCNGSTKEFSYTFTLDDADNILIELVDLLGDVTTVTSDFTVNTTLKKVTYPVVADAIATGYKLVITRNTPDTQTYDFSANGVFNAENITAEFDKITMLIQEDRAELARAIKWRRDQITANTDANDFTGSSGTSPGTVSWGDIEGTLSDQTDLNNALAGKSPTSHNHSSTYSAIGHDHAGTYQALDTQLTALAGTVSVADALPYYDSSNTAATTTFTSLARTLLGQSTTSAMRSTLEIVDGGGVTAYSDLTEIPSTFAPSNHDHASNKLAQSNTHESADTDSGTTSLHHTIGTGANQAAAGNHTHNYSETYQGLNTNLTALSEITGAADTYTYFTGAGSMTTASITSAGRSLVDDSSTTAMRDTLGTPALNGFENRTSSTLAMSGSDFQITTGTNYNIWTAGTKYNKTTTQSVAISTDNTLHFVYFNTSGTLAVSTTPWSITSDNVPVAVVYKTGSAYAIFDERHGFSRDRSWHDWAHDTLGTRYQSGGEGTFTNTTLSILRCYVRDEDLGIDTGGTKTACRLWYRNTGAASMTFESNISTPYKATAGVIRYDANGTLTDITNNNFVCNYVYCTNDIDYPIAVIVGQNNHNTIALARSEALPTIPNLPVMEWKLLYRVIYKNVGGTPTYQEPADYRTSSSLPAGGSVSTNASSVITSTGAFSGNVLTSSETTAQASIDKLDSYLNARRTRSIIAIIGDGTTVPSTGSKGFLTIPYACTITNWYITGDASGSAVVDIKRSGSSIIGGSGNKPTLSSVQRANAAASSWTSVSVSANDELEFNLDSVTTCKRLNITVMVTI